MRTSKNTAALTILLFVLALVAGAYPALNAQTAQGADDTTKLVREADEAYQNGNFKLAIEKYQQAMRLIGEKKELAQTKQELFQTMTSLALTYFTIQENAKAEKQLEDLIQINPNQELDPEFYPPKFVEIFRAVQRNFLGRLVVDSVPAGAEVTVNNNKSGRTLLTLEKMLKGKYSLKLELKGFNAADREIIVQAAMDNRESFQLEALPPVVEKKAEPAPAEAKKKKKLSPWIIAGGAAIVAMAIVLLTRKKTVVQPVLQSLSFNNAASVPIDLILPTYIPLQVSGVPAKIEKIDFRVVIEHPLHMEDLIVTIIGSDTNTMYNIWNRQQSAVVPTVMSGTINDFNNVAPNGTWRLLVQNQGHNPGGRIMEFTLKIFFYQ
ncbi:MAG: PEGA domain-containing protein [Candidatus Aminicenantes bacterium]|nr:PEGA domain-containing protein [Candidatus Aminicenantes bacterium]